MDEEDTCRVAQYTLAAAETRILGSRVIRDHMIGLAMGNAVETADVDRGIVQCDSLVRSGIESFVPLDK
jgi:hypothetical protein